MGVSRPFRDDLGCFELHPVGVSESLGALATGITACFGDLVWPGPDGLPMPAQTLFSRRGLPMRKGARIRTFSFHALRHTAATLALEDGQPPHVVAAMLGHASVATTLRLYAHVTHASTEALVDAIDARYGPRLRPSGLEGGRPCQASGGRAVHRQASLGPAVSRISRTSTVGGSVKTASAMFALDSTISCYGGIWPEPGNLCLLQENPSNAGEP
jgi:hypothetical protein